MISSRPATPSRALPRRVAVLALLLRLLQALAANRYSRRRVGRVLCRPPSSLRSSGNKKELVLFCRTVNVLFLVFWDVCEGRWEQNPGGQRPMLGGDLRFHRGSASVKRGGRRRNRPKSETGVGPTVMPVCTPRAANVLRSPGWP